jgi:D-alanyl-D-alanine carboxypeptidase/D-alanyl-D-alanine-endopeptidase (penicillin-binding protein 4)
MFSDPLKRNTIKYFVFVFIAILLLAGCQPTALMTSREASRNSPSAISFSPYPELKSRIDALLPDSLFPPASIGIKIVSLTKDEVLYEVNPSLLFAPASNQKLFTCAAAFALLGKDYPLTTRIYFDTISTPTIFVKGFGDPLLSSTDIDSISSVLSMVLPSNKQWIVAGDVSYFDSLYWGSGWMWDDEPDPTAMFITPLSVNSNAIKVKVKPGVQSGEQVTVTTEPPTSFVAVENAGTTTSDSIREKISVSRQWRERSNIATVTGQMHPWDSTMTHTISVWAPERYTLTLLSERLRAKGFEVTSVALDTVPYTATEVMSSSHRLDSVLTFQMKESDNLSAENVLKILGAEKRGVPGTAQTGLAVIKEFLSQEGIDTTRLILADGSGVSRYNLSSADIMVHVLQAMHKRAELFEPFYNTLPIAGVDGSLSNRMKGTPAQGNLRAKTGTLSGVSALSGYVHTADGELLAFSIMMQNFPTASRPYRQVQDAIGVLLSGLRREGL